MRGTKNNFGRVTFLIAILLAVGVPTQLAVEARTLQPIADPETENEVIQLYNRALRFSKGERNVHARILLEKAATYDPTSVSPYVHAALSEIYHDLGNPNRAIQEALKSLKFDPSQKSMYYNIGLYCKDAHRYADGIRFLERYVGMVSGEKRINALSLIDALKVEQTKLTQFSPTDSDYLAQLQSEEGAHQWARSKIPLKVYIAPSSSARGFNREFVNIAHNAFITWYEASGKRLSFEFIDNVALADINVEWTDGALRLNDDKYERMKAGLTTTQRGNDEKIIHSRIQVRTVRAGTRDAEPLDKIKETCLHEIGHALGLNGHSSNTADIMYFGNTARQLPALTKRDKATIARLYGTYPPYPMIGVDTSFPYPPPETDIPRLGAEDRDDVYSSGATTGGAATIGSANATGGVVDPNSPFLVNPNTTDSDAPKTGSTSQWTNGNNVATPGQSGWQMPGKPVQQWQTPPQSAPAWTGSNNGQAGWQTPGQPVQQWQTPLQQQVPPQQAPQQPPPQQAPAWSMNTNNVANPGQSGWQQPGQPSQQGWQGQGGWAPPAQGQPAPAWNQQPPSFNSNGSQPLQPWTPNQSPFNAFQQPQN